MTDNSDDHSEEVAGADPTPMQRATKAIGQLAVAAVVVVGVGIFVRPHSPFIDQLYATVENKSVFGSSVSCASPEAQELALTIIKDNSPLRGMQARQAGPERVSRLKDAMSICNVGFFQSVATELRVDLQHVTDDEGEPTCSKLVLTDPRMNFTPEKAAVDQLRQDCTVMFNEKVKSCRDEFEQAADREFKEAAEAATYTLDTIRTTDKNVDTGKVTCAAQLSVALPEDWGTMKREVSFTVEETTKSNEIYVTVMEIE